MTQAHMNFDLSKTDNVDSDVGQLNERNIVCPFCGCVIIWQGGAMKHQHNVSALFLSNAYVFRLTLSETTFASTSQ